MTDDWQALSSYTIILMSEKLNVNPISVEPQLPMSLNKYRYFQAPSISFTSSKTARYQF